MISDEQDEIFKNDYFCVTRIKQDDKVVCKFKYDFLPTAIIPEDEAVNLEISLDKDSFFRSGKFDYTLECGSGRLLMNNWKSDRIATQMPDYRNDSEYRFHYNRADYFKQYSLIENTDEFPLVLAGMIMRKVLKKIKKTLTEKSFLYVHDRYKNVGWEHDSPERKSEEILTVWKRVLYERYVDAITHRFWRFYSAIYYARKDAIKNIMYFK